MTQTTLLPESEGGIRRIVSGGQTGVDRAALDAALALGIACGGWCPRGRKAEDGPIPARYPLRETPSDTYEQRTRWNVRDSDGTLVVTQGAPTGGTALTLEVAREWGRPALVVDLDGRSSAADAQAWLREHRIGTLNVAGPRESQMPGIHGRVLRFLEKLLDKESLPGT